MPLTEDISTSKLAMIIAYLQFIFEQHERFQEVLHLGVLGDESVVSQSGQCPW